MKNIQNIKELTGLEKLTQEQLINIILRKDNLERMLRTEVKKLQNKNRKLAELIEIFISACA